MSDIYKLPKSIQHAVLNRIYPWDDRQTEMIYNFLYNHAINTGFNGTFEEFKQYFGSLIEDKDSITTYKGPTIIEPLVKIQQILQTKDKYLTENIIIQPISAENMTDLPDYNGQTIIYPLPNVNQVLNTLNTIMRSNLIINAIPYYEVANEAGGKTAYIGIGGDYDGN